MVVSQIKRFTQNGYAESPVLVSDKSGKSYLIWLFRETDNQEIIYLSVCKNGTWSEPVQVTTRRGFYESPVMACTASGTVMIVWTNLKENRFKLEGRILSEKGFSDVFEVPTGKGRINNAFLNADANESFWLVAESYEKGRFRIVLNRYINGRWSDPVDITDGTVNSYYPSVTYDETQNKAVIAYSAVDNKIEQTVYIKYYDPVNALSGSPVEVACGGLLKESPNFNSFPCVVWNSTGTWIAWETDGPHSRRQYRKRLSNFHGDRQCAVACIKDGKVFQVKSDTAGPEGCHVLKGRNDRHPTLVLLQDGRLLLVSRDFQNQYITGEIKDPVLRDRNTWHFRISILDGSNGWSEPEMLLNEGFELGRLSKPAVTAADNDSIWIAWQADNINTGIPEKGLYYNVKPVYSNICVARVTLPAAVSASKNPILEKKTAAPRNVVNDFYNYIDPENPWDIDNECKTTGYKILRGNLHEHTEISRCGSSTDGNIDQNYRYAMDVFGYDFMCITDHAYDMYFNALWRKNLRKVLYYNDPPWFVAIPGYEWTLFDFKTWGKQITPGGSHHNIIFESVDDAEKFVSEEGEVFSAVMEQSDRIDKIWDLLERKGIKNAVTIPHQIANSFNVTDISISNPEYRPLLEIYQVRGSFEYEGCPRQCPNPSKYYFGDDSSWASSFLKKGHRTGFVAGGDHAATGTGMTVVFAEEYSQKGIVGALKNRRCYATTGESIYLDFRINGSMQGKELKARPDDQLEIKLHVKSVHPIKDITIFKNGAVLYNKEGEDLNNTKEFYTVLYDEKPDVNNYYYLRVIQDNDEIAWSSPIWIDLQK